MVYIRTLLFSCIFHSILHTSYGLRESYGCEDLSGFTYTLSTFNESGALNLITLPLECRHCPVQVKQLRHDLLSLARQSQLGIKHVIGNLRYLNPHNRNDILLTTLMALNENKNVPTNIREGIKNVLFYLLKNRFLGQNNFATARNGFDVDTDPETNIWKPAAQIGVPIILFIYRLYYPANSLYPNKYANVEPRYANVEPGYATAINVLLEKLLQLERQWNVYSTNYPLEESRTTQSRSPQNLPSLTVLPKSSQVPQVACDSDINSTQGKKKMPPDVQLNKELQRLLQLLPARIYPKEKFMFGRFKSLLQSPYILDMIKSLDLTQYRSDPEFLDAIIAKVLQTTDNPEIRQVFTFWKNYKDMEMTDFNFTVLLDLLPHPKNAKERKYYHLIQELFNSNILYHMVHTPRFNKTTSLYQKLIILLEELQQSPLISPETLEAVNYYYYTLNKPEIQKRFDSLINEVPAPKSETEQRNLTALKQLLNNSQLQALVKDMHLVNSTTTQEFTHILKTVITHSEFKQYKELATHYRDRLAIQRFNFSHFNLLNLLPVSQEDPTLGSTYKETLEDYFYSPEFERILSSLNISDLNDIDKLIQILQAIQERSSSSGVVQAATYFSEELKMQAFYKYMQSIISILPQPQDDQELANYNIIKSFLLSREGYDLLKQIDMKNFSTNKQLLDFVLKTIAKSNINAAIQNAAEYYIDLGEKFEPLELITMKEIKKKFNLTEIFLDTLNPKNLTFSQKDAFKKFVEYISHIKPDVLSHFDSWDQAQTRGQFMQLLFEYLLKESVVAPEIKKCINILNSLVIMDGKGALPP